MRVTELGADSLHRLTSKNRDLPESLASALSVATLPPIDQVRVHAAEPTRDFPLALNEQHRLHVLGEEALSDAWPRPGEPCVLLRRRRKEAKSLAPNVKLDILWYTADLRFPCTCNLHGAPRAFTPSVPPIVTSDLDDLPPHDDPSQIPAVGDNIAPWSPVHPLAELDDSLNNLADFQPVWRQPSGRWPTSTSRKQTLRATTTESTIVQSQELRLSPPRSNKGKRKATFSDELIVDTGSAPIEPVSSFAPTADARPHSTPLPKRSHWSEATQKRDEKAWDEESKRRKRRWQHVIGKDPAYGRIFSVLPHPQVWDAPFCSSAVVVAPPDIPNYNLFRTYRSSTHPFHPDLHHYMKRHPLHRVHWIIPLHGPVVVPADGLYDPFENPDQLPPSTQHGQPPSPSMAIFGDGKGASTLQTRPATIRWSADLIKHFLEAFLLPLQAKGTFGALNFRVSGPKPEPFIDLRTPPTPVEHVDVPKAMRNKSKLPPVRAECGDHLRIYCDAAVCLSLRTWLHGIEVEGSFFRHDDQSARSDHIRLFDKVRLALIGGRGEVLMIA